MRSGSRPLPPPANRGPMRPAPAAAAPAQAFDAPDGRTELLSYRAFIRRHAGRFPYS